MLEAGKTEIFTYIISSLNEEGKTYAEIKKPLETKYGGVKFQITNPRGQGRTLTITSDFVLEALKFLNSKGWIESKNTQRRSHTITVYFIKPDKTYPTLDLIDNNPKFDS